MAISSELIESNEVLKGLSDEQKSAIVALSENEQKQSFDKKFLEILSNIDTIVKDVTGKGKNTNEKTSEYVGRSLSEKMSELSDMKSKHETEVAELREQIKKGDNASVIAEKDSLIEQMRKEYSDLKAQFDTAQEKSAQDLAKLKVDGAINAAMNGMRFVEMNEATLSAIKAQVLNEINSKNPAIKVKDGKEVLEFSDEQGNVILNKKKSLQPYTIEDMMLDTLDKYGVLAESDKGGGNGGRGRKPSEGSVFGGARNRQEAYAMIAEDLAKKGLAKGTEAYDKAFSEASNSDAYKNLPLI